jgi:hypothetical protein
MSGLSHTPGKRTKGKTFRGFESRPLRHKVKSPATHKAAGLFYFRYAMAII